MLAGSAQELPRVKQSVRILLDSFIDYAGLFPPASVSMPDALRNFDDYRRGSEAWALGRFIVPASRLDELDAASEDESQAGFLQLSVLIGDDVDADVRSIEGRHEIEAVELKASTKQEVERAAKAIGGAWIAYVEITDLKLLDTIQKRGMRAKIRAGGTTADAFPDIPSVAAFLRECAKRGLAFKATAGLHHPLRCVKPLTYEQDSAHTTMHGFINLLMATAIPEHAEAILGETDPQAFDFGHNSAAWRKQKVTVAALQKLRRNLATSVGSCSFTEPVADMKELGWL